MAREIIELFWCDPCLEIDDIRTEGEELPPVSIGNQKARRMTMCKQHREDFWEPFVEAMQKFGIPVDKIAPPIKAKQGRAAAAPAGYHFPERSKLEERNTSVYRVVCPFPECKELQKSADTVAGHLRSVHKTNLFEQIGREGVLRDFEGNPVPTPKPRPYGGQNAIRNQAKKK